MSDSNTKDLYCLSHVWWSLMRRWSLSLLPTFDTLFPTSLQTPAHFCGLVTGSYLPLLPYKYSSLYQARILAFAETCLQCPCLPLAWSSLPQSQSLRFLFISCQFEDDIKFMIQYYSKNGWYTSSIQGVFEISTKKFEMSWNLTNLI